jgi:hypothetical protein
MGKNTDVREAVEAELSYDPLVDAVGAAWMGHGVTVVVDELEVTG